LEEALAADLVWPYLKYHAQLLLGGRPQAKSVEHLVGDSLDLGSATGCVGRRMTALNYATDLDQLSGDSLIGLIGSGGGEPEEDVDFLSQHTVVGGMQALLKALVQRSNPQLEERVSAISRVSEGVRVKTNRRTIDADAVIVTVSIGVLKSSAIAFEPGLPQWHLDALDGLDMGALSKIWLQYPKTAWPVGQASVIMCDAAPIHAVFDWSKSHGTPIVMGMTSGRAAVELEALPKADAQNLVHGALQKQWGRALPEPVGFAMSRWTQNPLVGGAYMYPNTQFRSGDHLQLRKPIADRVLLAGEALADRTGYVDTAWSDGRRAANLLIG
ncbi:MAG: NAD(P)/FAD-dependent oxidoreductase, partial [Pseudomonadota bacterium]